MDLTPIPRLPDETSPSGDSASHPSDSGKMIRLAGGPSILFLLGVVIVAGVVLVVPIPSSRHHRVWATLLDLGHLPLFAFLGYVVFRVIGRNAWSWGLAAAAILGGEWIQNFAPGRTPDWEDALHGFIGVALAWLVPYRNRAWAWLVAAAIVAIPAAERFPTFVDVARGWNDFPVLADFRSRWEARRFHKNGAEFDGLASPDPGGIFRLKPTREYPGIEFVPVVKDWRGFDSLVLEVSVDRPVRLFMTIRDQRKSLGYRERFNAEKPISAGRHRWQWKLAEIVQTPGGTPLDLESMDSINLFVERDQAPLVLTIHRIELAPSMGRP